MDNYQGQNQNYYENPQNRPDGYYPPPQRDWEPPMSVKDWVITIVITMIPCVGFIMLFAWAFSSGVGNETRSTYAKARLIMMAIGIVIGIILYFGVFAGLMAGSLGY